MNPIKLKILTPLFSLCALTAFGDIPTYSLVESDAGDFNIVKYVENADGSYSTVSYGVTFGSSNLGDTSETNTSYTASYYLWDSTTNSYTTTGASADNYDIVVTGNMSSMTAATANATTESEPGVLVGCTGEDGSVFASTNSTLSSYSLYGIFVGNQADSSIYTSASKLNVTYGGVFSFTSSAKFGSINGLFIGNSAVYYQNDVETNAAAGGVIHTGSNVVISAVNADFIANYALNTSTESSASNASGGAINNAGTITTLTGDFIANYASSVGGTAQGGAINNGGTISSLTANFLGNYATTTAGTAQGGAINNSGTITFVTTTDSMQFTGNYVVDSSGTKTSNAINNTGTLNFNAGTASIFVNDGISGTGTININTGTSVFNNAVAGQAISVVDGATLALGSVTVDSVNYSADLTSSSLSVASGGTLSFVVNASSDTGLNSIVLGATTLATGSSLALDLSGVYGEFTLTISPAEDTTLSLDFTDLDYFDVFLADSEVELTLDGTTYTATESDDYYATFTVTETSGVYTITGEVFGTAVPEPSTYAMIIGVLALGFAYYRRRK